DAVKLSDHVAVMRNGVIEQIGAPRSIYERPRNQFVAGFLGASNFLDGSVIATNGVDKALASAAGPVPADVAALALGSQVRIAIRPERVRVIGAGSQGLPARIRDIVYRG